MIGTVEKRFISKKGTPMLTISGQAFACNTVDVSKIQLGDKIEYEGHTFGDGKVWALDKWALVQGASKYDLPKKDNGGGQGGISEAERIFAYGVVTESIKAGLIKDPEQIEKWVCAAKNALRSQGE